ncbi:hypothetical protein EYF80_058567 [Liparis tanakae]|uniref:Uncharacterized protein n=1 Tax=Liparis tanakae TaxID=230148 RepID=A0A4Z2ER59_9TELE|nr:hypothetical protein EYF80_058567 [Liparis tanakae]
MPPPCPKPELNRSPKVLRRPSCLGRDQNLRGTEELQGHTVPSVALEELQGHTVPSVAPGGAPGPHCTVCGPRRSSRATLYRLWPQEELQGDAVYLLPLEQ